MPRAGCLLADAADAAQDAALANMLVWCRLWLRLRDGGGRSAGAEAMQRYCSAAFVTGS